MDLNIHGSISLHGDPNGPVGVCARSVYSTVKHLKIQRPPSDDQTKTSFFSESNVLPSICLQLIVVLVVSSK